MPKMYDAIKKEGLKKGLSQLAAEQKAARITNAAAKPGQLIVTRYGEGVKKRPKSPSKKKAKR